MQFFIVSKLSMIFEQLFDTKSSTYTYIVSSGRGREALIIDPVIENTNEYIRILKNLDLKLVKVIDTHIHADHISGLTDVTILCDKSYMYHSKMFNKKFLIEKKLPYPKWI